MADIEENEVEEESEEQAPETPQTEEPAPKPEEPPKENEVKKAEDEKKKDEGEDKKEEKSKAESKKKKGKKRKTDEIVVEVPDCMHAWCFGEMLRKAGVESGVCCPKPLPWGRPGRLRYMPGWEDLCWEYQCHPVRYKAVRRIRVPEVEAWKTERRAARRLASFLSPLFGAGPKTPPPPEEVIGEKPPLCECDPLCCRIGEGYGEEVRVEPRQQSPGRPVEQQPGEHGKAMNDRKTTHKAKHK